MTATSIPLSVDVLGGAVATIAAVVFGLNAALARAQWQDADRKRAVRTTAIVLSVWFAVAVVAGALDLYRPSGDIPTIQYGLVTPIVAGFFLLRSKGVRRMLDAVPQAWIVGVQFYRVLGVTFLVLYAAGQLPGEFAWPAGAGDTAVGLLAPVIGLAYARSPRARGWMVAAWNALGIADLVVAVTTGLLTSPSPLQRLAFDRPNELIGAFPLVLIPTYMVPLAIVLHVASLTKLRQSAPPERAGAVRPSSLAA
ncbi:MAG TPA: hypothetical protein VH044_11890 [Polyangiaceae bacterium]|jgi:hypothetical protein|nr:hypothetical protein [Polyangiaceae bacterium]